jgi:translation initiation factor 2 subunit 2
VCNNSYKRGFVKFLMEYEGLLDEAYENVEATDECERFEVLKVKGHHEGVRTIISNFGQIVLCIRRKPEHFLKFLTKELASSGEIKGDRLILSRKLASKDVNDKIEKYVNGFVLCPKCKKPDTELENAGAKAFLRCLACGEKYEVHKI